MATKEIERLEKKAESARRAVRTAERELSSVEVLEIAARAADDAVEAVKAERDKAALAAGQKKFDALVDRALSEIGVSAGIVDQLAESNAKSEGFQNEAVNVFMAEVSPFLSFEDRGVVIHTIRSIRSEVEKFKEVIKLANPD